MNRFNIEVEITRGFDNDEKTLSRESKALLTNSLDELVKTARHTAFPRKLYKPSTVKFPDNIKREDSSLYVFKATRNLSVVLAFDDDPIFKRKLMTLFRVVMSNQIIEAFDDIANRLYR